MNLENIIRAISEKVISFKKPETKLSSTEMWDNLTERKIKEANGMPLRFVNKMRASSCGYYITIDKRRDPFSIIFFHANLDFVDNGTGINTTVVLEDGKPARQLFMDMDSQEEEWVLMNHRPDIMSDFLEIFRDSRLFNSRDGIWKGKYPNIDKVIEALNMDYSMN